jgi:hypothetical protein
MATRLRPPSRPWRADAALGQLLVATPRLWRQQATVDLFGSVGGLPNVGRLPSGAARRTARPRPCAPLQPRLQLEDTSVPTHTHHPPPLAVGCDQRAALGGAYNVFDARGPALYVHEARSAHHPPPRSPTAPTAPRRPDPAPAVPHERHPVATIGRPDARNTLLTAVYPPGPVLKFCRASRQRWCLPARFTTFPVYSATHQPTARPPSVRASRTGHLSRSTSYSCTCGDTPPRVVFCTAPIHPLLVVVDAARFSIHSGFTTQRRRPKAAGPTPKVVTNATTPAVHSRRFETVDRCQVRPCARIRATGSAVCWPGARNRTLRHSRQDHRAPGGAWRPRPRPL